MGNALNTQAEALADGNEFPESKQVPPNLLLSPSWRSKAQDAASAIAASAADANVSGTGAASGSVHPESVAQSLRLLGAHYWHRQVAHATAHWSSDSRAQSTVPTSAAGGAGVTPTNQQGISVPPIGDRLWLRALIFLEREVVNPGTVHTRAANALPRDPGTPSAARAALDDQQESLLGLVMQRLVTSLHAFESLAPVVLLATLGALDQLKAVYALQDPGDQQPRIANTGDWHAAVHGAFWFLCNFLRPAVRRSWAQRGESLLPDQTALEHCQYIMLILSVEYLMLSADRDQETFFWSSCLLLHLLDWMDTTKTYALIRRLDARIHRCVELLLGCLVRDTLSRIRKMAGLGSGTIHDATTLESVLLQMATRGQGLNFLELDGKHFAERSTEEALATQSARPAALHAAVAKRSNWSWFQFWPFVSEHANAERVLADAAEADQLAEPSQEPVVSMQQQQQQQQSPSRMHSRAAEAIAPAGTLHMHRSSALPEDPIARQTVVCMGLLLTLLSLVTDDPDELAQPLFPNQRAGQPFRQALAGVLARTSCETLPAVVDANSEHQRTTITTTAAAGAAADFGNDAVQTGLHPVQPLTLSNLHDVCVWWLHYPEGSYLFYFLTYDSAEHWRRYLAVRTDPEIFLLTLLRLLYVESSVDVTELRLATLLLLTEDEGWSRALASHVLEQPVTWYRETSLDADRCTLVDIVIGVLVRCIRRQPLKSPCIRMALAMLVGIAPGAVTAAAVAAREGPLPSHLASRLWQLFAHFWRRLKRSSEQNPQTDDEYLLSYLGTTIELLFAVWVAADFEPRRCGTLGDTLINAAAELRHAILRTGRAHTPVDRFFAGLMRLLHIQEAEYITVDGVQHPYPGRHTATDGLADDRDALRIPAAGSLPQRPTVGQQGVFRDPPDASSVREVFSEWARQWRYQQSFKIKRLVYRFVERPDGCSARIRTRVWNLVAQRTGWPLGESAARASVDEKANVCPRGQD